MSGARPVGGLAKSELRALKRLGVSGACARPLAGGSDVYGVFARGDRRRRPLARLSKTRVDQLVSAGTLRRSSGSDAIVLTEEGQALIRRAREGEQGGFRGQHMELERGGGDRAGEGRSDRRPLLNVAESPLTWLARRTDVSGRPYISKREFLAGERLRGDYHRGKFIGRMTSDWCAPPRGSKASRAAPRGDLDDTALAARDRVARAIAFVGPGLDGPLKAACLNEQGLDDIERTFGWPKRAGKVVLRIALSRLADHYGLPAE